MEGSTARGTYDAYAIQRIVQKLLDLTRSRPQLSLSAIADAISDWKGVTFHREYFGRLRRYELSDPHVNTIVDWIVVHHDPKFREKLTPDAIFWQIGESSRDFYFHFSQMDPYEAWQEGVLQAFSGVYLCAPALDRNSYLPSATVRSFFERVTAGETTKEEQLRRSLDIKQYIAERSILILKATPEGYYHAAEFPLSILFPPDFVTLDVRMVHEGIGVASGNSIRVFLRECLSRVGKSHSILIGPKGANEDTNPHGLTLFTAGEVRLAVREEWSTMDRWSVDHMMQEFAAAIEMEYNLTGTAQIEVSPIPDLKNRIVTTFSREYVYHRKPPDFLREPRWHFIRPDIVRAEEFERVISNPLSVGMLT
jgi:hypothetical protein